MGDVKTEPVLVTVETEAEPAQVDDVSDEPTTETDLMPQPPVEEAAAVPEEDVASMSFEELLVKQEAIKQQIGDIAFRLREANRVNTGLLSLRVVSSKGRYLYICLHNASWQHIHIRLYLLFASPHPPLK